MKIVAAELHIIFARTAVGPTPIYLSRKYAAQCDRASKTVILTKVDRSATLGSQRGNVSSFHTLYGANGSGKTQLLMDLRHTFSPEAKDRPVGVLFSADGNLQIFKGTVIGGWTVTVDGQPVYRSKRPPDAASIFYTTSPFEFARRRRYTSPNTVDASPTLGQATGFDALGLLDHYDALPDSVRSKARIQVRARVMSVEEISQEIVSSLKSPELGGIPEEIKRGPLRHHITAWLEGIPLASRRLMRVGISRMRLNPAYVRWRNEALRLFASSVSASQATMRDSLNGLEESMTNLLSSYDEDFPHAADDFIKYWAETVPDETRRRKRFSLPEFEASIGADRRRGRKSAEWAAAHGLLTFSVSGMSSGEVAYLVLLASLSGAIQHLKDTSDRPLFVLVDEGEMFMHPEWQRGYIKQIFELLGRFESQAKNFHVLITTHSLIVAGDSPPNTLINIETGEHTNGFGLGPKLLLKDVYGVESFAGTLTTELLEKLSTFINAGSASVSTSEAVRIAESLADEALKEYVKNAIRRRRLK